LVTPTPRGGWTSSAWTREPLLRCRLAVYYAATTMDTVTLVAPVGTRPLARPAEHSCIRA